MTEALTIISEEGVKSFGPRQAEQLTGAFGGVVSDITATLVNKGYSRTFEYQADMAAVEILRRTGYNPRALVDMLTVMAARIEPGRSDFASTHPSPENRITKLKDEADVEDVIQTPAVRTQRFMEGLGHLL